MKWSDSRSVLSNSLRPHRLYSPRNSPGCTGVGILSLLQGSSQPRDRTWVSRIAGRLAHNKCYIQFVSKSVFRNNMIWPIYLSWSVESHWIWILVLSLSSRVISGRLNNLCCRFLRLHCRNAVLKSKWVKGFPDGPVVKNPHYSAGDSGSTPGLGKSHTPWGS